MTASGCPLSTQRSYSPHRLWSCSSGLRRLTRSLPQAVPTGMRCMSRCHARDCGRLHSLVQDSMTESSQGTCFSLTVVSYAGQYRSLLADFKPDDVPLASFARSVIRTTWLVVKSRQSPTWRLYILWSPTFSATFGMVTVVLRGDIPSSRKQSRCSRWSSKAQPCCRSSGGI
jgi:hypothetical protein